jgi:hypothetical protein
MMKTNAVFLLVSLFLLAGGAGFAEEPSLLDTLRPEASGGGLREEAEDFDEAEFWENYEGPDVGVIHDNKSESDFLMVETETELIEYHYLNRIKGNNLVTVLTDLLRRITADGYIWVSDFSTVFGSFEDVALVYRIDKTSDSATGSAQFPDFSISISGLKYRDNSHVFDISSFRTLSTMVMRFVMILAQVEETLGIDRFNLLEYFSGE